MQTDILAVNPGSTSTKVGVFRCQEGGELTELFMETINHNPNHLLEYESLEAQQPYRREVIESVLNDKGYDMGNLRAVVGRGGQLQGLKSGGYQVNPSFCRDMMSPKNVQHASNLGAPLAYSLAEPLGIPSFIYDSTRGCELSDVAKVSGLEGLVRYGNCHVLNSRAQAIRYARSVGKEYQDMHIIVCHMGGGITVSAHEGGRIIDDSSYDEGPMSPERTGGIQLTTWTELCCSGKYTEAQLQKIICGKGGLYSYLGVTDCRQVEKMIEEGNQKAAVVYEAMAYQVAKSIAAMTIPLKGKVDAIILTGGAAHSNMLTGMIQEYAGHLGKIVLMPGENELEALAEGAWRILEGKEKANTYQG
ncbi:MAG: butyrate kinase [Anaerovoracaceae bacterium]|nr:butyrate kinase [Anaerovoracaceae bacterium]